MAFAGMPRQPGAQTLGGPQSWVASAALLLGWTSLYHFTYRCKHLMEGKR